MNYKFQIKSLQKFLNQKIHTYHTMIGNSKENVPVGGYHKFLSLQNAKNNKFSVYKYQKNILISRSDNFSSLTHEIDDHDYIQTTSPAKKHTQCSQEPFSLDNPIEQAHNLCDLWEKLGQDQFPSQNLNDQPQKINDAMELTEEQLLECFGNQRTETQQKNPILTVKSDNTHIQSLQIQKDPQPQKQTIDQDLMEIWGDQPQHKHQPNHQSSFKQQKSTKKINQEKEMYSWVDTQEKKVKPKAYQILQSQDDKKEDNSFQMELEDPNALSLRCVQKTTLKIVEHSNQKLTTELASQSLIKSTKGANVLAVGLGQRNEVKKETQLKTKAQKKPSQKLLDSDQKDEVKGHSILKEIMLQNNNKNMNKLIPGKDYEVYYPKLFVLSQFKPDTYSYFGIQVKTYSLLDPPKVQNLSQNPNNQIANIFYFYSFQTKQAFLQLKPQPFLKQYHDFLSVRKTITFSPGQTIVKKLMEYSTDACFKIRICSTKQHIATMFYKVIKDGYLFDLRLYDSYQNIHSEPIALVEVKDGFVNDCCYCDTNVFIERKTLRQSLSSTKKLKNQKSTSYIEKLKMILNIKSGKLTANMGINGIESSPYNCCLQNKQSNKFIYLMGLLSEDTVEKMKDNKVRQSTSQKKQVKSESSRSRLIQKKQIQESSKKRSNQFIIKVGEGVSPLLGLAITAGRKLYIDSFE